MVYNSAHIKMKKNVFFIVSVIVAMFLVSGCTKVVTQSSVHEFNVTFSNVSNKQTVTESYTGLKGSISSSDAILVYVYFGNTSGEDIWMPLPATVTPFFYDYAYTDSGIFVFTADAGNGNVWTTDFSLKYRVINIPRTAVVSKSTGSVNTMDYNEVMQTYNLYDAPVIRK